MNKGSCLCGDITWQVDGEYTMHVNCHCSICRKVHGSAYVTFLATDATNLRWLSGQDRIREYASSAEARRPFCPRCGSKVPSIMGELALIPAGNIDGDIGRPLDSHIFVGSKAEWFDISDEAPQFDEYPPGYDSPTVPRPERPPATEGATGGSCACGALRWEFDAPAQRMGSCHCSRCRRARSAAFSTQIFMPAGQFRWLSGEDKLAGYKLPEARYFSTSFCRDCGSPAPRLLPDFGMAMVPAGCLDQDPGIRPQAHIFVGSKAPWLRITDELPQFEAMPPR